MDAQTAVDIYRRVSRDIMNIFGECARSKQEKALTRARQMAMEVISVRKAGD